MFDGPQPFRSPFRCSWRFRRTQDNATTRQPAILCGWSGRLEQSPTAHSFRTYIINFQKHAQNASFLKFLLHWLTVSRIRAANIVQRPCSDSSHVTALYSKIIIIYYYGVPSVLMCSAVRTIAKSVALKLTVPSLFIVMFIATRRCMAELLHTHTHTHARTHARTHTHTEIYTNGVLSLN